MKKLYVLILCVFAVLLIVSCAPVETEMAEQELSGVNYYLTPEPTVCFVSTQPPDAYPVPIEERTDCIPSSEPLYQVPTPYPVGYQENDQISLSSVEVDPFESAQLLVPNASFDIHRNISAERLNYVVRQGELYWFAQLSDGFDMLQTDLETGSTSRLNVPSIGYYLRVVEPYIAWYSVDLNTAYVYDMESEQIISQKENVEGIQRGQFDISNGLLVWNDSPSRMIHVYDFMDGRDVFSLEGGYWPVSCSQSWIAYLKGVSDTNAEYVNINLYNVRTGETIVVGSLFPPRVYYSANKSPYYCDQSQIAWQGNEGWYSYEFVTGQINSTEVDFDPYDNFYSDGSYLVKVDKGTYKTNSFLIIPSSGE